MVGVRFSAPVRGSGGGVGTLRTSTGLRVLSPADLPRALALLAREPLINVFVEHRTRQTGLDRRTLGGEMWGYQRGDNLVAMCHSGANLVPVCATSQALASFAERAIAAGRICSSIVGPCEQVDELWDRLRPHWGPERLLRTRQPFLVADQRPTSSPIPASGWYASTSSTCSIRPAWRCSPRRSGSRPRSERADSSTAPGSGS